MDRRVVITGMGLVTPLGIGVDETWQALCAGKSGVSEITRFDAAGYATRIAAEVKGFIILIQPVDYCFNYIQSIIFSEFKLFCAHRNEAIAPTAKSGSAFQEILVR